MSKLTQERLDEIHDTLSIGTPQTWLHQTASDRLIRERDDAK